MSVRNCGSTILALLIAPNARQHISAKSLKCRVVGLTILGADRFDIHRVVNAFLLNAVFILVRFYLRFVSSIRAQVSFLDIALTDFSVQPFTNDFPRADIHELLSPDILHQIIKGTFKDHIVDWVEEYLTAAHTSARANQILAEIDRRYAVDCLSREMCLTKYRIALAPPFSGLRRFPEGRGFKQWTGDDTKALMKVRATWLVLVIRTRSAYHL